ncbi:hypothetical protein [Lacipirellula sp.]|uniref:hypothetical protein n=1 Tax=Lacipirellula sp. TaxID=2691419 RepID=UPI003D0E1C38
MNNRIGRNLLYVEFARTEDAAWVGRGVAESAERGILSDAAVDSFDNDGYILPRMIQSTATAGRVRGMSRPAKMFLLLSVERLE